MPSMISVAVIVIGATVAALVFLALARRPARAEEEGSDATPFECGAQPSAAYPRRIAVQYFLTALIFVIMLIALLLLAVWARDLMHTMNITVKLSALLGAGVFVALVTTGFIYAWRVGAFDWEK